VGDSLAGERAIFLVAMLASEGQSVGTYNVKTADRMSTGRSFECGLCSGDCELANHPIELPIMRTHTLPFPFCCRPLAKN
jgi:hypothetical protein